MPAPEAADDRQRVLVIDDEEPLARIVASYLAREGFDARVELDGEAGLRAAREQEPAVVVLDLMLPGIDGIEVCRRLRTFSDAYVVMLTARDEEIDKIVGLSVGADDYVTKPFSPRELVARVKAMLRRPRVTASASPGSAGGADPDAGLRRFGPLTVDEVAR